MDLRQLNTFRTVMELGSLSKAADKLRIAQPALSRQIKLLEHELRTPLFVRHGRGMAPTEAGARLFERTSGVIRQLEQARDDVRLAAGDPAGRVVLGMVPTISSALALPLARQVAERYPLVSLRLVEAYTGFLIDGLHRSEIDLALIYGSSQNLHLNVETLRSDNLFLIGASGSALRGDTEVELAWAARQPLILPSAPHALRLLIDDVFARAGLTPDVRIEADSFQALMELVSGGLGMTFLPLYAARRYIQQGVVEAVAIDPPISRKVALAMPYPHCSLGTRAVAGLIRADAIGLID